MLSVSNVCYEKNKARQGRASHNYCTGSLQDIFKMKTLSKTVVNIK